MQGHCSCTMLRLINPSVNQFLIQYFLAKLGEYQGQGRGHINNRVPLLHLQPTVSKPGIFLAGGDTNVQHSKLLIHYTPVGHHGNSHKHMLAMLTKNHAVTPKVRPFTISKFSTAAVTKGTVAKRRLHNCISGPEF